MRMKSSIFFLVIVTLVLVSFTPYASVCEGAASKLPLLQRRAVAALQAQQGPTATPEGNAARIAALEAQLARAAPVAPIRALKPNAKPGTYGARCETTKDCFGGFNCELDFNLNKYCDSHFLSPWEQCNTKAADRCPRGTTCKVRFPGKTETYCVP